jgi:hypothetical protein
VSEYILTLLADQPDEAKARQACLRDLQAFFKDGACPRLPLLASMGQRTCARSS